MELAVVVADIATAVLQGDKSRTAMNTPLVGWTRLRSYRLSKQSQGAL
jgi:hypothetical protein